MKESRLGVGYSALRKLKWQIFYGFLASRFRTPDWQFMNYGYAGARNELPLLPEDEPNRYFIQMYSHILGQAGTVAGRDVLEVGCGRGGGSSWIARTQDVRSMTGMDSVPSAIALCKQIHEAPNLTFRQGDAERLPFADSSFDVVLNVESCHHYPSLPVFLDEVARVLRPGGALCVATYWDRPGLARFERAVRESPLELVGTNDIAAQVTRALRSTNALKAKLIRRHVPWFLTPLLNHFAGVEGSDIYRGFIEGRLGYVSALLRRPQPPAELEARSKATRVPFSSDSLIINLLLSIDYVRNRVVSILNPRSQSSPTRRSPEEPFRWF